MPAYGVPRRSFSPQNSAPINWRRGLLRLWLLVSAAWIMSWVILLTMSTLQGGFKSSDFLVVPVLLFGPPVALLMFGVAAKWTFCGFGGRNL